MSWHAAPATSALRYAPQHDFGKQNSWGSRTYFVFGILLSLRIIHFSALLLSRRILPAAPLRRLNVSHDQNRSASPSGSTGRMQISQMRTGTNTLLLEGGRGSAL